MKQTGASSKKSTVDKLKVFYRKHILDRKLAKEEEDKILPRLRSIGGGYNGSNKEYKDVVLKYWSRYGLKPHKCWYDLYCAGKDSYDPRYIPNHIWLYSVIPHFNRLDYRFAYADKGMYSRFLPGVKKPETVVKNIAGLFYNGDGDELITRKEAKALILNEEHLILKPSLDSYGGHGIVFYDRDKAEDLDLDRVIDGYKNGFVAQRLLKQHPDLARINKDSVNSIRVISFRFKGEVHILSTVLRMGVSGARVDNTTAGGCACPIKPDGWLVEKAVNRKSEWTDRHETSGILYKDIRVPNFEGIIEAAKKTHGLMANFNLIGWDFSVDESGDPVLIEYNLMPEQNQISCGPTFGDITDKVLDEVFLGK